MMSSITRDKGRLFKLSQKPPPAIMASHDEFWCFSPGSPPTEFTRIFTHHRRLKYTSFGGISLQNSLRNFPLSLFSDAVPPADGLRGTSLHCFTASLFTTGQFIASRYQQSRSWVCSATMEGTIGGITPISIGLISFQPRCARHELSTNPPTDGQTKADRFCS